MMKLSEAIRLGGTFGPQIRNAYKVHNEDGSIATCALGGALLTIGYELEAPLRIETIPAQWRPDVTASCPVDGYSDSIRYDCQPHYKYEFIGMIVHLNDIHGWSREQIADWVEGVERDLDRRQRGSESQGGELPSTAPAVDSELATVEAG